MLSICGTRPARPTRYRVSAATVSLMSDLASNQDEEQPSPDADFSLWVSAQPTIPGQLSARGATLKVGPQVCKTVLLAEYGDQATGEVRKRELTFRTSRRQPDRSFDFAHPSQGWSCQDDEIDRLLAFLHAGGHTAGRFRLIDAANPAADVLGVLADSDLDAGDLRELAEIITSVPDLAALVDAVSATPAGISAAEAATIVRRREVVAELRELAVAPGTTETEMHSLMRGEHWLFGGKYVGLADRQSLVPLDSYDLPLLTADGTLHLVELKSPAISRLVRRHRNHYIVGHEINEAVGQAMNYVRGLDEQGLAAAATLRNEYGIAYDVRRVFATVVVGHPSQATDIPAPMVRQTIRSYNAHLSRVEVLTYEDLLDAAARGLDFQETRLGAGEGHVALSEPGTQPPSGPAPGNPPW
jgi:hypothetical protein